MDTKDYLLEISKKYNPKNDSAIADMLGIRASAVSKYRKINSPMSDKVCERVAELLDIPLEKILLDMHVMSAPTPKLKAAWMNLATHISLVGLLFVYYVKYNVSKIFVRRSSEISI